MKLSAKAVLVVLTLVLALPAVAQEVTTNYAVAVDLGGNVYTGSAGPSVSKTGGWQLALGGNDNDAVLALAPGRNGTLYAAGTLGGGGFVARINAQGERAGWLNLSGTPHAIGVDSAGVVYVAGDGYLEKLDAALNPVYKIPLAIPAAALAVRPDGTVLLAQASLLATYSPEGRPLTAFDLGHDTSISAIALSPSGAIYVTGSTTSSSLPAARDSLNPPSQAFVTKIAADGVSAEWSIHVGGSGADGGSAIAVHPDGGLVLVGYTGSFDFPGLGTGESLQGGQDAFIAQLDAEGKVVQSSFAGNTHLQAVAVDTQGRIHTAGMSAAASAAGRARGRLASRITPADQGSVTLVTAALLEGPGAGSDSSIVLTSGSWSAAPTASWLHTTGSGGGNGVMTLTYDANSGATRTGYVNVGNATLTVTQAGSSLVPAGLVTVVSSGLTSHGGLAVDSQGNLYIADQGSESVAIWTASTQQLSTVASVPYTPLDVSLDAAGDVFIGGFNQNINYL